MAGFGPPPSETKRRTNPDTFAEGTVTVDGSGQADAPGLPGEDKFLPQTVAWYQTWAASPQAQAFEVTDWQRLHMLAHLVDRYFESPTEKRFAEIRQNESLLGATHLDRLRGRIKVARPAEETSAPKPANVAELEDARRARLMADAK